SGCPFAISRGAGAILISARLRRAVESGRLYRRGRSPSQPPSTRFDHQPVRRGLDSSSCDGSCASVSGAGEGGALGAAPAPVLPSPATGTGSRTVERRRG